MLTEKQRELLLYIHKRLSEDGVSPSFDEMKEALNLASKSGVHRLVSALEERGFIRRLARRARALEVLKQPNATALALTSVADTAASDSDSDSSDSNVVRARFSTDPDERNTGVDIPVLGRIAAGVPIEAIEHEVDRLPVPQDMISGGEHFALEVSGDSMIKAGILDGDLVIIKRSNTADTGDIVVALIHDEEATLKKLRRKGDSIALEAANHAYETRIFRPGEVKVQGKLVGLIRRYH